MGWTFLFLMVFLKLPIVGLLGIVWWAVRAEPEPEPAGDGSGDGGSGRPRHPRPPLPRRPRRGPHGGAAAPSPARVRTVVARAGSGKR